MWTIAALIAGFIIDMIVGDPHGFPHPVIWIGKLISFLEKMVRKVFPSTKNGERAAGLALWVIVCGISTAIPILLIWGLKLISPWLSLIAQSIMCWQMLAAKSLKKESMKVYAELKKGDEDSARYAVSMIVGRDTERLDDKGITKAAVETVAENTSDGVVAPLFYMAILGVPFGFFYKAVNTMDSMLGYTDPPFAYIGMIPAKADDIMNFIPSRISALLMLLAGKILNIIGKSSLYAMLSGRRHEKNASIGYSYDLRNGWRIFKRDRYNHASPNSAQTESVCAGELLVQLAGDAWYHGILHKKKYIGDPLREIEYEDIKRSCNLMYMTSVLALAVFSAARFLFIVF